MTTRKKTSVLPIYLVGFVWLGYALLFPLHRASDYLICAGLSGLLEGHVMADYVIGVSAGIAYGVSYVSRQPRRNLEVVTRFAPDRRYMGWRNLADKGNRSYFGLKFGFSTIPNELVPFDYDAFEAFPGEVEAVVTNLNTGKLFQFP